MYSTAEIQQRDDVRARLAEQMATFEATRGAIVTSPTRIGDPPQRAFRISNPDKPKAPKKAAPPRRQKATKASPAPKAKRGTRQARQRAVLAEVWP